MFSGLAISLSFCLSTIPASAQQASSPARHVSAGRAESKQATRAAQDPWWKHSVIYEIYPRSFQDSNGDGVGDLKGITSRLDYLHDLGIAAIWITPMYPSPLVDFGYDVADYTALDPLYGNLTDFDHLVAEAKKRNIRVIMDFVPNHTSDEHPWFKESRSSRTNPKRDWYIWRDGKGPGQPPNDWQSWFGDRKSTRLNSSHGYISYAVFCLQKTIDSPRSVRGQIGRSTRTHHALQVKAQTLHLRF